MKQIHKGRRLVVSKGLVGFGEVGNTEAKYRFSLGAIKCSKTD
jgi:hypothetical protein